MPSECPHCGADLPPKAKVCRECGSDEQTGWSEEAGAAGASARMGIPEDDFDYNEFAEREFGTKRRQHGTRLKWYWVLVALGLVALMIKFALP